MKKLSDYKKDIPKDVTICFDIKHASISNIDEMLNAAKYFYDITIPQYDVFFDIKGENQVNKLHVYYIVNMLIDWGVQYKNIRLRNLSSEKFAYLPLLSLGVKFYFSLEKPKYEVKLPHYTCCNKNIVFTAKQGTTCVCQGYCCGNGIDICKYFLSFNKSYFFYRFSRDFVYCEQLLKVETVQKRFIFENLERDMSLITDCYGEMKPTRELFAC